MKSVQCNWNLFISFQGRFTVCPLRNYAEIGDILQEACNLINDAAGISQKLCILVDSKEICSAMIDQSTSDWKYGFRAMELAGIVNLHKCLVSPSPADKHNQWSRMTVMI